MESGNDDVSTGVSDTSSDVENDEDASLIDYARYHGLSKDYTSSYPLSSFVLQSIPTWDESDLSSLPEFVLPDKIDVDEKWTIDHQGALFLRHITTPEVVPFIEIARQPSNSAEFKAEPLLLLTDPELDQRRFKRARCSRRNQSLQDSVLEGYWEEGDETQLYWPNSSLPVELVEQIKQERLQLDRNDILFLQQCVSTLVKPEYDETSVPPPRQARDNYEAARHTSPLLPCSSPFKLAVPDSPVSRIPFATSPVDPVPAELSRVEGSMDLDDGFSLDGLSDISAFDIEEPNSTHATTPLKRQRPEDYKIEVPLSPALLSSSPTKRMKMVTFSDELCTTIPEYAKPFSSNESSSGDEISNDFLEKVLKPGAESAISAVRNEQLTQVGSTLRAEIPAIDHTGQLPPWEMFSRKQLGSQTEIEAQRQTISMLKRETISPREAWPGIRRIDRALARWRPFNMRLSDLPREEILCDYLDDFRAEEPQDTTIGWKLDGLRILDTCEEDDEAIGFADMSTILDGLDLTENMLQAKAGSETRGYNLARTSQPRQPFASSLTMATSGPLEGPKPRESLSTSQPLLGGAFSVSNSLDRFMQTHTGKKANPKVSKETNLQPVISSEDVDKPTTKSGAGVRDSDDLKKPKSLPLKTPPSIPSSIPSKMPLMYLPSLPDPVPSRTFVLSSTMFDRRTLVKSVERLNPMARYIERDFASARSLRGMSSQTSEADEADIILAPGHGILLTTLQKLMQKSLPGQVTRNVVRERIVQLARRYERLIVMVHEDRSGNQQRPLDNRDSGEIVSLTNFCAAQSHGIQVMYIPGDEIALVTWILASMVRFGLDDPEIQLLQEETSWELFLRKAGMDAFAAQVILIKLKEPDAMPTPSDKRHYGLPAFVMMSEAERLGRFSRLFGGEKILRKVSMAIDGGLTRAVVAGDLKR